MNGDRLYPLLPAWYRGQDAASGLNEQGRAPIEAWLEGIEASFDTLHRATGQVYDDWFVETCSPELLPAIGGLVGLELDGGALPGDRRLVGNAIRRWRRKGSLWALRDALEAASGWPVEIGEFENELVVTEATGYRRPAAALRRTTPALGASRGPSLRRIEVRVRRGFGVVVENAEPAVLGNGWYGFDASGLAVPVPADRVGVRVDGESIPLRRPDPELEQEWQRSPERPPAGNGALLDAPRGRFWLPEARRQGVRVDWVSFRPGPIGAGLPSAELSASTGAWQAVVSKDFTSAELGPGRFRSIAAALDEWPPGADADVRILDSANHPALTAPLRPGRTLTLHAHPGELPCVAGIHSAGALRLSGILVAGDLQMSAGARAELCSVTVRGQLSLCGGRITRSMVGAIEVTAASELELLDSIVGARSSAGAETPVGTVGVGGSLGGPDLDGIVLRAERTTFLGWVRAGEVMSARDCLFRGPVILKRPHAGRFDHSPCPRGSRVGPDAHRCAFEPETAPRFASVEQSSPGYGCLVGPESLLEAASDGGEPGGFHLLGVRTRMARLGQMLERFLPADFESSLEVLLEGMHG